MGEPTTFIDALDTAPHVVCGRHFRDVDTRLEAQNPSIHDDGCGATLSMAQAYRCTECGCWFHRECATEHFGGEMKTVDDNAFVQRCREIITDAQIDAGPQQKPAGHYAGRILDALRETPSEESDDAGN